MTTPTGASEPMIHYHVGIIVEDLDTARAHLTDLLGVEWGAVMQLDAYDVRLGDGRDVTVPNRLCYTTRAPYLELIQEVPGTPWVCNEHSNLHHIGFWTPDLAGESARLSGSGCPMDLRGRGRDGRLESFAYHRDPLGVRIELVDDSLRETMTSMLFTRPEPDRG